MFYEKISSEYMIMQNGSSEGTQLKYRKDNFWYKKDKQGKEGLAEYLASALLQFSDLDPQEYVKYEQGYINDIPGCRSKNFLEKGASVFTFYRLYYNEFGKDLSAVISSMDTMEDRIEFVIRFLRQTCNLDVTDYLRKILTLDMLILNEDRHLNNLAVLFKNDTFYPAPIFDNGVSLLTANISVNWHFPVQDNIKRVTARPFSGSHENMVRYLGTGFRLDIPAALKWLEKEPDSGEKEVLQYQLNRYKSLLNGRISDE